LLSGAHRPSGRRFAAVENYGRQWQRDTKAEGQAVSQLWLSLWIQKRNSRAPVENQGLMAVETVIGEPVSAVSFPVSPENTGKILALE
jgi:hypothetical protein